MSSVRPAGDHCLDLFLVECVNMLLLVVEGRLEKDDGQSFEGDRLNWCECCGWDSTIDGWAEHETQTIYSRREPVHGDQEG